MNIEVLGGTDTKKKNVEMEKIKKLKKFFIMKKSMDI